VANNLVSLVTQFLTPDLIGRIAVALGLDRNIVQTAVNAAVPALLAAFTGAAAKPGGAQGLTDAIKQQSGTLDAFAKTIGSGEQSSLIDTGSRLLTSLLGGQDQSALASAVGRFSGLGQSASNSLLGMLAPVIMGAIGRQIGTHNVDANNVANLLNSQKSQIAQALPSGFGNLLGGTRVLDALATTAGAATVGAGQVGRAAATATDQAAQYVGATARDVGTAAQRAAGATRSSVPMWLYWLVPLLILGGLLWYVLNNQPTQVAQNQPTQVTPQAATPTPGVVVSGVDVGKQVNDSITALRASLQSITDEASAKSALPKLHDVQTQMDKVTNLIGQLSPEQRKVIVGLVGPSMATLNQLFDKVLAIPGVGEALKPTIDALKADLTTLAA
jgi:hypothetical protein